MKPPRLTYVDWMRGLAALIMLQGHTFHAWLRQDLRGSDVYQLTQLAGGLPSVLFLFLTGISLVILIDRDERRGAAQAHLWKMVAARSGLILGAALAFRVQQWAFWLPHSSARDILKVDILNVIGVGLGLVGAVILVAGPQSRLMAAAAGAVVTALATPLVWNVPDGALPSFLLAYLKGSAETFSIFPWISYTFTGALVGMALLGKGKAESDRAMQWLVLLALVLIAAARFFDSIPYSYYQPYNYWLTSPNLVANRTAAALLVLAACYGWTSLGKQGGFSWVRQLGHTSLLVYWVHIEVNYGRLFSSLQGRLDVRQTLLAVVVLIAAMLALSVAKTRWKDSRRLAPASALPHRETLAA